MKRIGNIFDKICDIQNIELADDYARRGKNKKYGILKHDKNRTKENLQLQKSLQQLTYNTSKYSTFTVYEPKKRLIYRLPYYPDRITHWAIMNILEPIWTNIFIKQSYSCVKDRGIHNLLKDLKKVLTKDKEGTKYCLKLDIVKFYPSIDHDILKQIIRRKIKDKRLLILLDNIINSTSGVPIGNYLSQFFANLYLTYFDHWLKEEVKVKYYFRYADDIVILSDSKDKLRQIFILVKLYLKHVLNLNVKHNYQVFPVNKRGIDFVGYVFHHSYIILRKSIKYKIKRLLYLYYQHKISFKKLKLKLTAYFGWLKYCNSKHFLQYLYDITSIYFSNWCGIESNISKFYNKYIKIIETVKYNKYFKIHFIYHNKSYSIKSQNKKLFHLINNNKNFNFKLKQYVNSNKN